MASIIDVNLKRKTKRLLIRPLQSSDYEAWYHAHRTMQPPQNRWDRGPNAPSELTPVYFRQLLSTQKRVRDAGTFFSLAVFEKESGLAVGTVAIMDVLRGVSQTAFLGYSIYNQFWGRGYGKESAEAAIDIGFNDIKLHRIEAGVEPSNRRSIRLARALGLRREGLKKRAVFLRGRWNDLIMYTVTCEDLGIPWKGKLETYAR